MDENFESFEQFKWFVLEALGDCLVFTVDAGWVFWPPNGGMWGHISPLALRILADELDARNSDHDQEHKGYE